jgi:hypothetical protein
MKKPRGKAKPIPIEAVRLARDIERLRRLEAYSVKKNREAIRWAKANITDRIWKAFGNAQTRDDLVRAMKHCDEPKAERVIRAYWSTWNVQGLSWGERALEMSKLGFNGFRDMSPASFKTLCTRRLKLKLSPKAILRA